MGMSHRGGLINGHGGYPHRVIFIMRTDIQADSYSLNVRGGSPASSPGDPSELPRARRATCWAEPQHPLILSEIGAPATIIFIRAKPLLRYVAKHTPRRRRRNMSKYTKGRINFAVDLGTLAA